MSAHDASHLDDRSGRVHLDGQPAPPKHWTVRPLRWLGRIQTGLPKGKQPEGESVRRFPYLRVANVQDGYLDLEDVAEIEATPGDAEAHLLRRGDVLMNEGGDYDKLARGAVWKAQIAPCLHQNHVFAFRPSRHMNPYWINYETQAPRLRHYFCVVSKQTTNLASISVTTLGGAPVHVPPREEQDALVWFLDRETARIDAVLAEQERVVALLQERRAALISRAVLGGLTSGVQRRPSGIGWIGDVPSHWAVMPLRWALRSLCDGPFGAELKSGHYTPSGVRVVRLQNIGEGRFKDQHRVFVSHEYFGRHRQHDARPNDVLVAALGDEGHPVGRACLLPSSIPEAMVKADCFRLRLHERVLSPAFVVHALSARAVRAGFDVQAHGATRSRIGLDDVRGLPMVVPPREEQDEIVTCLDQETARIDAAVEAAGRVAALLRERRTSLIHATVTGAMDVRDAASLPGIRSRFFNADTTRRRARWARAGRRVGVIGTYSESQLVTAALVERRLRR